MLTSGFSIVDAFVIDICKALLNSSELQDKLEILVLIDFGNCFIIDGGCFELTLMYSGLLLGFLYG